MKVLIVSTSDIKGGASVAARRLAEALNNNGVEARMLVRERLTDDTFVIQMPGRWRQKWNFLWERLRIFVSNMFSRKNLFAVSIANTGQDITHTKAFQDADIIHLHWINQGMLSLKNIRQILQSDKPVVWTMHDMWPATAICHYVRGCNLYHRQCRQCPFIHNGLDDLAVKVWRRKQRMLDGKHVTFVACSRWLEVEARKSALLDGMTVTNIPNPIDSRVFCPQDKTASRTSLGLPIDKRVILFVSQRVTDPRKGMDYFVEAIKRLSDRHPGMSENTVIAILGGSATEVADRLSFPVWPLGYVSDLERIIQVYNSADVFVTPSLEDNLPNTIMEAMACGVPCVGFRVGGIPEMIDHLYNGYVAEMKNADDLAEGIRYVLNDADRSELSSRCTQKVAQCYSQHSVASRYVEVYKAAISRKS